MASTRPPPSSFSPPPPSSLNPIPWFSSYSPPFRLIKHHSHLKLMPTSPPPPTSRPCFPPSSRNASTCNHAKPQQQRHNTHVEEYEEDSWHFWNGPSPGDLAEVEAFCRIFRIAEQLHNAVISALCSTDHNEDHQEEIFDDDDVMPFSDPSDKECIPFYEEKVVAGLGCIGALLRQQKQEVLHGRLSNIRTVENMDKTVQAETKPPLAQFRGEMKKCCELLEAALSSYFPPVDEQSISIHRKLQSLRNVCFDAGYPRPEGSPRNSDIPNWAAVRLWPGRGGRISEKDEEVAFWRGGQITEEGLNWLLNRGIKMIVDLRAENGMDQLAKAAVDRAVSLGKIKLVKLPVEPGTAPTMEQVEDFAKLVAAPDNRHVYLHSQEGIGRTLAMVSRWRELTHRRGQQVMAEASTKTNGCHCEEVLEEDATCVKVKTDGVLTRTIEESHGLEFHNNSKDISGTTFHSSGDDAPVMSCENHENALEFGAGDSGHVEGQRIIDGAISENRGDTVGNQGSVIDLETLNPFEAQRPALNAFSKRAMSQFWKQRKTGYMFRKRETQEKSFSASMDENETGLFGSIAGPAGRWALAEPGIPRAGVQTEGLDSLAQTEAFDQGYRTEKDDHVDICKDLNERLGTSDRVDDSICQGTGGKPVVEASLPQSPRNKSSNGSVLTVYGDESHADDMEEPAVAGDMCASTTGVVRLQSRKKAEMYLVRTDGFSCTREKVKESTLAFTHPSTQQQMLMWKTAPKTVLLLKKLGNELMEEAKQVASFLHYQEGMNVVVEPEVHDRFAGFPGYGFVQTFYNQNTSDLHERVDFVVCLGGDGVILHASNLFRNAVPPVVSFSLGSLGFLTAHPFEDFKLDLRAIIHGNNRVEGVYITLRMRLRCELFRNGKPIPGKVFDVLNEVVVDRGSNPYLCKIECFERNRLITKVQADGVIVATPTGSTAYSTSAGGSMVHPNVPCMLFTPICPHSLSFRPVILPDSALLEMKVPSDARSNAWVSFDGKRRQQLSKGDSVRICMSEHPLPTVNKSDQTDDWFRSLVRCLNWNERLEQKAFAASL